MRHTQTVCVSPDALDLCVYDCICLLLCPHDSCWLVVTCDLEGGRPLAAARLDARGRWLASFGVSTHLAQGRGQCVMAERAFAPGDVVLSSEPFASVLFPALRNERCHECFSRAAKLSRCSRCKVARYCSTVCQQRAWHAHHKFQCAIQGDIDHACETLPPVAQQELCLLIQVALKAIAPSPTQPAAESQGAAAAGSPCRGEGKGGWGNTGGFLADFDDVLGMPSHDSVVQVEDPQRAAGNKFLADVAHALLRSPKLQKKRDLLWHKLPTADELSGLLSSFACNDFSIWDELLVAVGAGVYPLGALLNHSCEPNVVLYYHAGSHRQEMRCIRHVALGEVTREHRARMLAETRKHVSTHVTVNPEHLLLCAAIHGMPHACIHAMHVCAKL